MGCGLGAPREVVVGVGGREGLWLLVEMRKRWEWSREIARKAGRRALYESTLWKIGLRA